MKEEEMMGVLPDGDILKSDLGDVVPQSVVEDLSISTMVFAPIISSEAGLMKVARSFS